MSNEDVDAFLAHHGVLGMHWGIRKTYTDYQTKVQNATPGAIVTKVTTKNGETISVEKEKPGPLMLAVKKLTHANLPNGLSSMVIKNSSGKKVGSFQVWREKNNSVRGEWLSINKKDQGRGYSKAALNALLISAKKDKTIDTVRLQVPSDALPAKHIYSELGFSKEKDLGYVAMFGNLEDWKLDVKH
jgi:ribosomal protein S18 acetylase RimI-like enzyme